MRILLLSYYFPPYNSIGAVRVGKTAKYLHRFGHELRVVAAKEPTIEQPGDLSLPIEVPRDLVNWTDWFSVNNPGEKALRTLLPRKSEMSAGRRVASIRMVPRGLRTLAHFVVSVTNVPDPYIGWYPHARRACSTLLKSWRPDVIVASGWPFTGLMLASALSRRYHIPWVAELRDLWSDHQAYSYQKWRRRVDRVLERRTLSTARGLITVSQPLADVLREKYDVPVEVITNGFDPCDYGESVEPLPHEALNIVYTGQLYPGKQDLSPLFQALKKDALTERVGVSLYLRGDTMPVRRQIESFQLQDRVRVLDPVAYQEALRLQASADVLLMANWLDASQKGIFTGKFFEYLGARRPILAVGPSDNVVGDIVSNRNLGVTSAEPDEIAAALAAWLEQKRHARLLPLEASQIAGFSREDQTRRLERFIEQHR